MSANNIIIEKTKDYVKEKLSLDASGHDWWHIHRVHSLAKHIAKKENANVFIVELTALLHDISDWKLNGGDDKLGAELAEQWLKDLGVDAETCKQVAEIIKIMSFKGAMVKDNMQTLEGKIVQDADRLDAIGAIGIARTFAYGGSKHRLIYNPNIEPTMHTSFEQYKKDNTSTINHFYEKLLLLKDRMNTETGRSIALERHKFMEQFLEKFLEEWNFSKFKLS